MPKIQGHTGASRTSDNQDGDIRMGNQNELLTGAMNGFFFEQVMRGNGYVFSTALAGNALVAATTSNAPAIWNPPGSGRALVIQKVAFGRSAVATPLEGSIVHLRMQNVNSYPGTGAAIVSATFVAALNLRSDLGDLSGMFFAPTTISYTTGPVFWCETGISQNAATGTTTQPTTFMDVCDVNGLLVVYPGTVYALGATVSLSTTYCISIYALSLPLPLAA